MEVVDQKQQGAEISRRRRRSREHGRTSSPQLSVRRTGWAMQLFRRWTLYTDPRRRRRRYAQGPRWNRAVSVRASLNVSSSRAAQMTARFGVGNPDSRAIHWRSRRTESTSRLEPDWNGPPPCMRLHGRRPSRSTAPLLLRGRTSSEQVNMAVVADHSSWQQQHMLPSTRRGSS